MWGMHPLRPEYYYSSSTLYSTYLYPTFKQRYKALRAWAHGRGVVNGAVSIRCCRPRP